jgi:hypothetical protein
MPPRRGPPGSPGRPSPVARKARCAGAQRAAATVPRLGPSVRGTTGSPVRRAPGIGAAPACAGRGAASATALA